MASLQNSEFKSLLSSSSVGSGSHGRARYFNVPLHELCSTGDLQHLHEVFRDAHQGKLFPTVFRQILRDLINVDYDDNEYKILFMKINTNRNGVITWDELVSYLLQGFYINDSENQRETVELPIVGLPKIMHSKHRLPVSKILFCPDVFKDRSTNMLVGSYLTISREGLIHWWTLSMNIKRSAQSSTPHLQIRPTWITDMVCLPDVSIVVTSSTERELRFYDCTAGFTLKILISSWDYMICTMHYYFPKDESENCLLICGDAGGGIRVLAFSPFMRGPFQSRAARAQIHLTHADLQKRPKLFPAMQLIEYKNAHGQEWVRQVYYYATLHCVVSCATCNDALFMFDLAGTKTNKMFRCEKGIQCFVIDEKAHLLVTGGPDCNIRLWNPFVPSGANGVWTGHHAGIVKLVLQDNRKGRLLYSLSRDRIIKVWDVLTGTCVQTYIDIPDVIGVHTPITSVYNTATRDLILASVRIAIITLNEQLNPNNSDGNTHLRSVSKVLYNPLFKCVITCGTGSIIFNWNPFTGQRNMMVRGAHAMRSVNGELVPVEITAACFDPAYQLLLTGARDGTLKIWNFNNGECLRKLNIERDKEVTAVFWINASEEGAPSRILAVGWNRYIVEFEASGATGASVGTESGKAWMCRHSHDVLAAAVFSNQSIATASYDSELVFWKLETGQPYRRFSCSNPSQNIKMYYAKREREMQQRLADLASGDTQRRSYVRRPSCVQRSSTVDGQSAVEKARARRVSTAPVLARENSMRQLAVHAIIYLQTRISHPRVVNLLVALENGQIQAWSDHPVGGILGSFQGVHTAGDYVSALTTDTANDYLFTGTTVGYIKVWLMKNFIREEEVHVCMPALRLEFPFLWRDRIEGRAKRCVRDQPLPLLLNSYRAHMRCVTSLAYIDDHKLLVSGSADYSVRVWRLSGEYINTLGGIVEPWTLDVTRIPPDVKKVASFTTFKVWRGGYVERRSRDTVSVGQEEKVRDISEAERRTKSFGQSAQEPILGNYTELPQQPSFQEPIVLDSTLRVTPLYTHLRLPTTTPVRRPPTPEIVHRVRARQQPAREKHTHFIRQLMTASDEEHRHASNTSLYAQSQKHNNPNNALKKQGVLVSENNEI